MNNVLIFHGTEGYPEENWFPWLKNELEQIGCKVSVPHFPSLPVVPAKIAEWFNILKNYTIDENTVIVGHSLGGVFTLRVLEKLNHKIKGAILIGTPVGELPIFNYERDVAFCGFDFNWDKIKSNCESFTVFQSDDDPYVGLANGEKLAKNLGVEMTFIPNAGHFNKKAGYIKFPQVLEIIKTKSKLSNHTSKFEKFNVAPFHLLDQEWALLTAGNNEKFNTMTISWGGLGTIWNKPVVTVYVKPIRHTYSFMESNEFFTISFYDENYKNDLGVLGSKSGKSLDKISLTKLTPEFLENSTTFKQAKLTIICKKIYFQDLDIANIEPQPVIDRFYKTEQPHRMYIGEVIDIIDKRPIGAK